MKVKRISDETRNFFCLMAEGGLNSLGGEVLGISSILPLFMADYGASHTLIGAVPVLLQALPMVLPLFMGNIVSGVKNKKKFTYTLNGIFRTMILLLPLIMVLAHGSNSLLVGLTVAILMLFYCNQHITGFTWNYLVSDCIGSDRRGVLLGTLFGLSGAISLFTSFVVKNLIAAPTISLDRRYFTIFLMAGIAYTASVFCLLPLKTSGKTVAAPRSDTLKDYINTLAEMMRIRDVRRLTVCRALDTLGVVGNIFIYIYAQNELGFSAEVVSNLVVLQALGMMFGGFVAGRISKHAGNKMVIIISESISIMIPVCAVLSMLVNSALPMYLSVLGLGLKKGFNSGTSTYMMDVVDTSRLVLGNVSVGLVLVPFTLISILVGRISDFVGITPILCVQTVFAIGGLVAALMLRDPRAKQQK